MDATRPDFDALRQMATEFEGDVAARLTKPEVKDRLSRELPREGGAARLAFKLADRSLLELIPECMGNRENTVENRGKADDLWDKGFEMPEALTPGFTPFPQTISYALLGIVFLLSVEWMTRKILRLA